MSGKYDKRLKSIKIQLNEPSCTDTILVETSDSKFALSCSELLILLRKRWEKEEADEREDKENKMSVLR